MLDIIKRKIKALIEDFIKSEFEVFEYTTSKVWTLSESNISSITKVLKTSNSTTVELGSGEYSYDSTTNKIEIIVSLVQGDVIEVDYTFTKYSDTELDEYIRASLVWISVNNGYDRDFELELDINAIVPTPTNRELDLISLIAAIIIKPNYTSYNLPNLKVSYPRNINKEEKIQRIISKFASGIGISDIITLD